MLMEIDEVLVPTALWERAKAGDLDAVNQLRQKVHGLDLYVHNLALPAADGEQTLVTLRELQAAKVVDEVRVANPYTMWVDHGIHPIKVYPQAPAVIQRWHDGDTCELVVQHTLTVPWRPLFKAMYLETAKLRLARINCPELKTPRGPEALARSMQLAPPGSQVILTARGFEKYGRILGDLTLNTTDDLATLLLAEGLATAVKGVPVGDWELL